MTIISSKEGHQGTSRETEDYGTKQKIKYSIKGDDDMNKKWKDFSAATLLKWAAMLVIVFALSLPVTAETSHAANTTYTVTVADVYKRQGSDPLILLIKAEMIS